ncbi:MAG: ABC transporter ATP-binding protein [Synergistetes bacterium]|nr:ABC transporter ATP-binding protein [Synergistota bacterium]
MGSKRIALEARDLLYEIGGRRIINGVSLKLEEATFYSIIGPNGCGKTTLLDLLSGVREPSSGEIRLYGMKLGEISRRKIACLISLMPQSFDVSFDFYVYEVLLMGRYPHRGRFSPLDDEDLKMVERVVKELNLSEMVNRRITSLSGGERQRSIFGRVLVQDTPILFLDEATSNLDPYYRYSMLDKVYEMTRKKGITVVSVFHDLSLAFLYGDYILMMKEGKIVHQGEKERVLTPENILEVFNIEVRLLRDDETGVTYPIPVRGEGGRCRPCVDLGKRFFYLP